MRSLNSDKNNTITYTCLWKIIDKPVQFDSFIIKTPKMSFDFSPAATSDVTVLLNFCLRLGLMLVCGVKNGLMSRHEYYNSHRVTETTDMWADTHGAVNKQFNGCAASFPVIDTDTQFTISVSKIHQWWFKLNKGGTYYSKISFIWSKTKRKYKYIYICHFHILLVTHLLRWTVLNWSRTWTEVHNNNLVCTQVIQIF